jgi:hypothetical protein
MFEHDINQLISTNSRRIQFLPVRRNRIQIRFSLFCFFRRCFAYWGFLSGRGATPGFAMRNLTVLCGMFGGRRGLAFASKGLCIRSKHHRGYRNSAKTYERASRTLRCARSSFAFLLLLRASIALDASFVTLVCLPVRQCHRRDLCLIRRILLCPVDDHSRFFLEGSSSSSSSSPPIPAILYIASSCIESLSFCISSSRPARIFSRSISGRPSSL